MQDTDKVNILLVDDRPENLLALEGLLQPLGQNLVKASSGEEALKCVLQKEFAAILLDVQMPDMDGFETATLIRKRQKSQHTPIIFLTALSKSEQFVFKGYSVGAIDYLIKPLIPDILISKVKFFIELFKKTEALKHQARQLELANQMLEEKIKLQQYTETMLRLKKGEFEAIFNSIPDAVLLINYSYKVIVFNPAFARLFGYRREEIVGQGYDKLYKNAEILRGSCTGSLSEHAPTNDISYVAHYIRKDGSEFVGEAIDTVVRDTDGKALGLLAIIRDITERQQAEAKIERLSLQNQLILNFAGEGIYGLNREGKTTFINPSAAKMLGYEADELVGQSMHDRIQHLKAGGTPYLWQESPICRTLEAGTVQHVTDSVFWRKDGSSFPVEYISTPIETQGEISGAVITFKDISDRLALTRIKDEFISVVSHELRTPLTAIHGALDLLEQQLVDAYSETGRRVITIAAQSAENLVRIVNDILDLERLQSGKISLLKQPVSAATLMQRATDLMQVMAERCQVTIELSPQDIELEVDADRVVQVLTNLLDNAIKFSSKSSTIWLSVTVQDEESRSENQEENQCPIARTSCSIPHAQFPIALFEVRDTGRGIPADNLESIFDRFHQVDASDSRQKGGTGLGLAICKNILFAHEGKIWVESILGKGSSFYFTLPLRM